ncbi:MAG TPA: bifunctional enoyl-CoA hydratase/phosphate acetyltransferase [Casimicrobiaceae bacterium]|jgi:phosphate acetyltransferase|nr:bifunctional enoyl-CoA hydratase/phosphate acetyltransferase [Casimicrobiaceae bacterium]
MAAARNRTFDEIAIGDRAAATRVMSAADVDALAFVAGEVEPAQLVGKPGDLDERAPGAAAIALVSSLVLRQLPGPGSAIVETQVRSGGTIAAGDVLDARVEVIAKDAAVRAIRLACDCRNQRGEALVDGTLVVTAPVQTLAFDDIADPSLVFRRSDRFAALLAQSAELPPVTCAVVHPCDRDSLEGALQAAARGMIVPTLVGPEAKIRAAAAACGADLAGIAIVATEHSHAAAAAAAAMARDGNVDALMKGSLHTDELMEAVVADAANLRTARRMSQTFILDVPAYPRLLFVTDAAINITPDLKAKADIAQNAIDLARILGIECPKVAILAAVEVVNPKMQATLDAAALCKMADRGQITGGVLDGPLAFDNAVSPEAAKTKGIVSPVAGCADILLAPDLDAGNMVAKQLQYLAGAASAGIVMGARVPIVLTSRADSVRSRLASTAVMKLCVHARRTPR